MVMFVQKQIAGKGGAKVWNRVRWVHWLGLRDKRRNGGKDGVVDYLRHLSWWVFGRRQEREGGNKRENKGE